MSPAPSTERCVQQRYAVCDKTYQFYQMEPYRGHFAVIAPGREVRLAEAKPFNCAVAQLRDPKETKGQDYTATTKASPWRDGGNGCL